MSKELPTHPLVKAISHDPDKPAATTPVVGYLGPSTLPDHQRIYNDLSLQNYLEVPTHAIEKVEPLDKKNENSPSVALVKSGTDVQSTVTRRHKVEAGFLNGVVSGSYLNVAEESRFHRPPGHTVAPW